MFSHSCNGTNIFIWWKMKCTIQLGFASLNRTLHLSPHENICTIAPINIHYLYTNSSLLLLFHANSTLLHLLSTTASTLLCLLSALSNSRKCLLYTTNTNCCISSPLLIIHLLLHLLFHADSTLFNLLSCAIH